MADKRLLKLIQQCRTKQVLDYVKQHGEDAPKSDVTGSATASGGNQKSAAAKSKKSKKGESFNEAKYKFNVQRHTDDTIQVKIANIFFSLKIKL